MCRRREGGGRPRDEDIFFCGELRFIECDGVDVEGVNELRAQVDSEDEDINEVKVE